jgi:hypothetical protein
MKTFIFNSVSKLNLAASCLLLLFLVSSCQKQYDTESVVAPKTTKEQELAAIKKVIANIPKIVITEPTTGKGLRIATDGFTFVDPGPGGFSFADPSGYQWNSPSGTLYVSASSFGMNGGGNGSIQLGSQNWSIPYTFCFAAEDDFFGAGLFGNESMYDGVAGVVGINGDFNKVMAGGEIEDVLNVIAMYFVYAKRASGNYPIVNFIDYADEDDDLTTVLRNKGFALALDFKNKKIYLSKEGSLQVTGGNMNFTGKYFEADMKNENNYKVVNGLGVMGCP